MEDYDNTTSKLSISSKKLDCSEVSKLLLKMGICASVIENKSIVYNNNHHNDMYVHRVFLLQILHAPEPALLLHQDLESVHTETVTKIVVTHDGVVRALPRRTRRSVQRGRRTEIRATERCRCSSCGIVVAIESNRSPTVRPVHAIEKSKPARAGAYPSPRKFSRWQDSHCVS